MNKNTSRTKPDVFILESLRLEEEHDRKKEGLLLSRSLRIYRKRPIYYYFRTERELEELAKLFQKSCYRYLHISCTARAQFGISDPAVQTATLNF